MIRSLVCAWLVAFSFPATTVAQKQEPPVIPAALDVRDRAFVPYLQILIDRSPTFRAALAAWQIPSGEPIRVVTTEAIPGGLPHGPAAFLYDTLSNGQVISPTVIVDLLWMWAEGERQGLTHAAVDRDVLAVLAHEIYAHALSVSGSGAHRDLCGDVPASPSAESCSVRRENEIRAELGLPVRRAYIYAGLALYRDLDRETEAAERARAEIAPAALRAQVALMYALAAAGSGFILPRQTGTAPGR